jgi:hypothetical protein
MPSEPRKPPSPNPPEIYLRFGNDLRAGQKYIRLWDMSLVPKDGLAKYEPAIPRCKTCGHRRKDSHGMFCAVLRDTRGNAKPVELDGYCDQHAEAERA